MLRLLDFENAILDLFEKNRITIQDAKIVLWILLTAIYEDELIQEPQRRETIIVNELQNNLSQKSQKLPIDRAHIAAHAGISTIWVHTKTD
jgi:hypothetical protein